jgi:asparagine synthase (glutamine-hydrolysing)
MMEFLSRGVAAGHSPYREVYPVPPGCAVVIAAGAARVERFWRLPLEGITRLSGDAQYEEQFTALFSEAVQCRLETPANVAAELSGGMDSSSIVCMANRLISSGSTTATGLIPFAYEEPDSPDGKYQRIVERHCGLESEVFNTTAFPYVTAEDTGCSAPLWWAPRLKEIRRRMVNVGANTILTGRVGDLIMGNLLDGSEHIAHYLHRLQPRRATAEALAWSRSRREPFAAVLGRAMTLACPWWAKQVGAGAASGNWSAQSNDLLTDRVVQRAHEVSRTRERAVEWREVEPGRRLRLRALYDLLQSRSLECPEPLLDFHVSHCFTHRPLVEYMMTIPTDVVYRLGEPRRLMRRALIELVPLGVLQRRSKAAYARAFRRALRPLALALTKDSEPVRLVEYGYLEPSGFIRRLHRLVEGLECDEVQLRNAILLEFWLRNRERSISVCARPRVDRPYSRSTNRQK